WDLVGLVALGRAPTRPRVEVVGHRTREVARWRLDGHDHTITEVRSLAEADGVGERDAAQAARSRYPREEPLPLRLDAVVRTLERAPRAVQHFGRADARGDERHDHEHGRPGQPPAGEPPVHLARRHEALTGPALRRPDATDADEAHEDAKVVASVIMSIPRAEPARTTVGNRMRPLPRRVPASTPAMAIHQNCELISTQSACCSDSGYIEITTR